MKLTETEAVGKICPLSLARESGQMEGCYSSGCAMWRWACGPEKDPRHGYCGLAGKVEE